MAEAVSFVDDNRAQISYTDVGKVWYHVHTVGQQIGVDEADHYA